MSNFPNPNLVTGEEVMKATRDREREHKIIAIKPPETKKQIAELIPNIVGLLEDSSDKKKVVNAVHVLLGLDLTNSDMESVVGSVKVAMRVDGIYRKCVLNSVSAILLSDLNEIDQISKELQAIDKRKRLGIF